MHLPAVKSGSRLRPSRLPSSAKLAGASLYRWGRCEKFKYSGAPSVKQRKSAFPLVQFYGRTKLQYVNHFNYLGIKLDCSFSFELHASECIRMVAHKLYFLGRIRKFITTEQAITIYKSKIVPHFDYGDTFLMNITAKTKQKLQKYKIGHYIFVLKQRAKQM